MWISRLPLETRYPHSGDAVIRHWRCGKTLDFALTYTPIGAIWSELGSDDNALKYYEKRYQLEQQMLPLNHACINGH
ncbi:unnamed protein product [Rotaria magnacalcarata]|uniref:Uncharacterized protein n=1 Tax=Rotaria magnacalcarata TaxID=392030 RepID=A0A819MHX5_9BILA|nr:unnamed protein product [Rotaria magnacalcarata]